VARTGLEPMLQAIWERLDASVNALEDASQATALNEFVPNS